MSIKNAACFFLVSFFCLIFCRFSLAQQLFIAGKEDAILLAFDMADVEQRQQAIIDSMFEAQGVLDAEIESGAQGPAQRSAGRKIELRPHAYFTDALSINDNYDTAAEHRKSMLVNSFKPGVKMDVRGKGKRVAFDVSMDTDFYDHRRSLNAQSANVNILTNFSIKRFALSISENYFTNYFGSHAFGIDDDRTTNSWSNAVSILLARHYNRIGFDFEVGRSITRYEPLFKSGNTTADSFAFNQYLQLAPKTRLLLGYNYGRTKLDLALDPNDSHSNAFDLTLTGVLSRKISAMVTTSYTLSDTKMDDSRNTSFSALFGYRISRRSDLSLNVSRTIHEESTKSNYSISDSVSLSGNRRLAFNSRVSLSYSGGLAALYLPKRVGYSERDLTYRLGLGLTYAFRRWLDFDLAWAHERNASKTNLQYHKNVYRFNTHARF